MTTYDYIINELRTAMENGEELEDIRDNSHEWVDGYLPIYNNYIIEEWQQMPGDYDDRGALEGLVPEDSGIVARMSADLYFYYTDLVALVLDDLAEELAEKEEQN